MTTPKDIARKQAEIVGQLQQFPIGRSKSGGRAGGTVEVVVTNPLPGQPKVVQAKCANDCPPGDVQLIKADDGSYVALSPNAAVKTSEATTRQISKKNPTIPKKDEEVWPVTSCFLYSRIKAVEEDLTDNLATDLTSYDARESWTTTNPLFDPSKGSTWNTYNAPPIKNTFFVQRADSLGDYETAQDALDNKLKVDRTFTPPAGSDDGGAADDSAWGEGSENAVTAWFYIGDMTGWAPVERNIFYARGNGYGNFSGPDYQSPYIQGPLSPCMTMYQVGSAIEALYASLTFGQEPLSKYLKSTSFQNLGGKIGYWGAIRQWHGMQDFAGYFGARYDRSYDFQDANGFREPTSQPPDYPGINYPAPPIVPWSFEGGRWYQFGWPRYSPSGVGEILLSCSSEPGNIRVYNYGIDPFSSAAGFECGGDIPGDNWSGYRLGDHSTCWMQEGNPSRKNGMFVCWQGDLANLALASSFCSALQDYFSIDDGRGGVTLLGSCNPYGCKGPPGTPGNGYPKAPLGQRAIAKQFGHKAEIWLKLCDKEKPPIELKLPFEFAAVVTKMVLQNGALFYGQSTIFTLITSGGDKLTNTLECPHATMAVDKDFVYVDILYGGEREWAAPQIRPVPTKVSQGGSGMLKASDSLSSVERILGKQEKSPNMFIVGEYNQSGKENFARYKADYFAYCQSFKIALPKPSNGNQLTIVGSQRYRRGQTIQITERSPDNEFNNKFLICDFRTDMREQELEPTAYFWPNIVAGAKNIYSASSAPNPDYASFGGLPALLQGRKGTAYNAVFGYPKNPDETLAFFNVVPKFYKPQSVWTDMDKIHFQLQESPKMIFPMNTSLPPGEFVKTDHIYNGDVILFDGNGKFGKHGRAAAITSANRFGSSSVVAPQYGDTESQSFLLYTSFKEQLIGNGLKNDAGLVVKWNRVSTSSFPIFGQLARN